jgi:hypothetical protein
MGGGIEDFDYTAADFASDGRYRKRLVNPCADRVLRVRLNKRPLSFRGANEDQ